VASGPPVQGTERRLSLIVDFEQGWDSHVRIAIEDALRKCIVEPPQGEDWVVSLAVGFAQHYCEVQVRTPSQTRTRFFFEDPGNLPQAITDWIQLYPLR
jgi:hypothetical protein